MRDDNETPTAADQGFSLIDVIVATSIMSVVMVMVTGAIIEIYSNVDRIDSVSAARDQIGNSFRRLDKELRYATWVSTPGKVGDAWYVEFATDTNCQQLVFADGKLTRSTWTSSPTPAVGPAIPIAGELTLTGTTPPITDGNCASPASSSSVGESGLSDEPKITVPALICAMPPPEPIDW
jgi:hypothetical protein